MYIYAYISHFLLFLFAIRGDLFGQNLPCLKCIHVYIHTHMHANNPRMPTQGASYIHRYIHTYVNTYIYIHNSYVYQHKQPMLINVYISKNTYIHTYMQTTHV
jgi:hypothetical protein